MVPRGKIIVARPNNDTNEFTLLRGRREVREASVSLRRFRKNLTTMELHCVSFGLINCFGSRSSLRSVIVRTKDLERCVSLSDRFNVA